MKEMIEFIKNEKSTDRGDFNTSVYRFFIGRFGEANKRSSATYYYVFSKLNALPDLFKFAILMNVLDNCMTSINLDPRDGGLAGYYNLGFATGTFGGNLTKRDYREMLMHEKLLTLFPDNPKMESMKSVLKDYFVEVDEEIRVEELAGLDIEGDEIKLSPDRNSSYGKVSNMYHMLQLEGRYIECVEETMIELNALLMRAFYEIIIKENRA